jgi:aminoglycoside 6-adenylyltransferase
VVGQVSSDKTIPKLGKFVKAMRSEQQMMELILGVATTDERVRAVVMNGSRANPNAPKDIFQDFDIVYIVTDVAPFKDDQAFPKSFGNLMILQRPDDMNITPHLDGEPYTLLMQFTDGNRIDLTLFPVAKLSELSEDSQSILLLDKDNIIKPFPPASDKDYLPRPPTAKNFADCCNEFWWVSTYVAKGLWREEITYAKEMQDVYVRVQLMKMLEWYMGIQTDFTKNSGKSGKYFKQYLESEIWNMLMATYSDADYQKTWDALEMMSDLFRVVAKKVAEHFRFEYVASEDENVTAHLKHVRGLPKDAEVIY